MYCYLENKVTIIFVYLSVVFLIAALFELYSIGTESWPWHVYS